MCVATSVPDTDLGSSDQPVALCTTVQIIALKQFLLHKHAPECLLQARHATNTYCQVQEVFLKSATTKRNESSALIPSGQFTLSSNIKFNSDGRKHQSLYLSQMATQIKQSQAEAKTLSKHFLPVSGSRCHIPYRQCCWQWFHGTGAG